MAIPENPFQEAETALTDLDGRVTILETGANQAIIDRLNTIEAENAALKSRVTDLEATTTAQQQIIDQHENRLDAVSAGAQG